MDNAVGYIPHKIANAWVTGERVDDAALFGYKNGSITISFQKNGKADRQAIYDACIQALNKHFNHGDNNSNKTTSVQVLCALG